LSGSLCPSWQSSPSRRRAPAGRGPRRARAACRARL
jgi:hypothetical protein